MSSACVRNFMQPVLYTVSLRCARRDTLYNVVYVVIIMMAMFISLDRIICFVGTQRVWRGVLLWHRSVALSHIAWTLRNIAFLCFLEALQAHVLPAVRVNFFDPVFSHFKILYKRGGRQLGIYLLMRAELLLRCKIFPYTMSTWRTWLAGCWSCVCVLDVAPGTCVLRLCVLQQGFRNAFSSTLNRMHKFFNSLFCPVTRSAEVTGHTIDAY